MLPNLPPYTTFDNSSPAGTPQGGIISPALALIALSGLELSLIHI